MAVLVIDLFGLEEEQLRSKFPEVYQHVKMEVKEKIKINRRGEKEYVGRDWNDRPSYKEKWWIFGEPRSDLRPALAGLSRYVVTVETMQHRSFQTLDASILPDNRLIVLATDDMFNLGVLSSRIHLLWTAANGGTLEDRPVYTKSRCFDPFPFPDSDVSQKQAVRVLAEELDAHRKRVLADHPRLALTDLYNILEKLRAGITPEEFDDQDRRIFDDGLVLIMKELHDRLDVAVANAFGWPPDLSDSQILARLVALNRERSDEEKRGLVRWLRPDYQIPRFARDVDKQAAKEEGTQVAAELFAVAEQKPSFPSGAVEQTAAIFAALAAASAPLDAKGLAVQFKRTKTTEKKVSEVLASLARLGYVTSEDGKTFALRRAA
jgi:hypothetical protein